jgi:phosphinothricin acetyltransferase
MSQSFTITDAEEIHLPGILAIYNHAVAHTTAVFNYAPVDVENRRAWRRSRVEAGFPVLVAQEEDAGDPSAGPGEAASGSARAGEGAPGAEAVLGYASYGPFRPFDGYRLTAEHSVYVAEPARRRGLARALMLALEERARAQGLHVLIGGIGADNEASLRLHAQLGYSETGRLPQVGQKFGRWLDLVFMQKLL